MRIGVSSWSMNRAFFKGEMDIISFIRAAREEFGVDGIETVHWMIPNMPEQVENVAKAASLFGSTDPAVQKKAGEMFMESMGAISRTFPANLDKVKEALAKYDIKVLNMPIDYGNISQPDDGKRREDLSVIRMWIDVAAQLGSGGARVNTGSQPEGMFDLKITAASYRELAEYAATKGMALILENHGGMSADPDNILKLFKMVDHPNFRICPDFGNFADDIRYEALEKIFTLEPILVHAKTYDFNDRGEQDKFDFGRCMEIAGKHHYDGWYSVEFEGWTGDQPDGIKRTIALLKRHQPVL
jgi:sugar phosphate isomerase/epimerase